MSDTTELKGKSVEAAPAAAGGTAKSATGAEASASQARNRAVVILLYALLAASAAMALLCYAGDVVPDSLSAIAPVPFGVFYVIFVIYRAVMIRRRRYPMPKGVFQVGMGALFLVLLISFSPASVRGAAQDTSSLKPLKEMLRHADPSVRALACDAFGVLSPADRADALETLRAVAKSDRNAAVRGRAEAALARAGIAAGSDSPAP